MDGVTDAHRGHVTTNDRSSTRRLRCGAAEWIQSTSPAAQQQQQQPRRRHLSILLATSRRCDSVWPTGDSLIDWTVTTWASTVASAPPNTPSDGDDYDNVPDDQPFRNNVLLVWSLRDHMLNTFFAHSHFRASSILSQLYASLIQ